MDPTPVAVAASCCTYTEYLTLIGTFATVILLPAFAFWREMRAKRVDDNANAVISGERVDRYNATRNATPVTNLSPPMSTGDAAVDQAVTDRLALAPVVNVAPSSGPGNEDIMRLLREILEAQPRSGPSVVARPEDLR